MSVYDDNAWVSLAPDEGTMPSISEASLRDIVEGVATAKAECMGLTLTDSDVGKKFCRRDGQVVTLKFSRGRSPGYPCILDTHPYGYKDPETGYFRYVCMRGTTALGRDNSTSPCDLVARA